MPITHERDAQSAFPFLASGARASPSCSPTTTPSPTPWLASTTGCTGTAPACSARAADAEDALQETLLRAWRARRTQTSDCPRAWLYRIATNVCFDTLARRDATLVWLDDPDQRAAEACAPPEQRPDATLIARETVELALLTALQQLPPLQQSAWILRDVLSCSAKETATALATSLPATNSALQRARTGLRARLAPGRLQWACARAAPRAGSDARAVRGCARLGVPGPARGAQAVLRECRRLLELP